MIRVENFKALLKERKLMNVAAAAILGVSHTQVTKLLSNKTGTFGEKAARKVEERFGIPRGWLDVPHEGISYSEESLKEVGAHPKAGENPALYLVHAGNGVHPVTSPSATLIPVITREKIYMLQLDNRSPEVKELEHLPADGESGNLVKWFVVDDKANEDKFPEGSRVKVDADVKARPPKPGNFVIVRTRGGSHQLRRYSVVSDDHFQCEATSPGYAVLDSQRDGLVVVAVVIAAYITYS